MNTLAPVRNSLNIPLGCLDPHCPICAHRPAVPYAPVQATTLPANPFEGPDGAVYAALAAFLTARDRKLDDGDALQAFADAEAVLTNRLQLTDGLDRAIYALTQRYETQKRTGDVKGATATASALTLVKSFR